MSTAATNVGQVSDESVRHLNIEPFHFPAEAIVQIVPPSLPDTTFVAAGSPAKTYVILLDDIRTPGRAVFEHEARELIDRFHAQPCYFVLETELVPLAWSVLRNLRPTDLKVEGRYIYLVHAKMKILLFRGRDPRSVSRVLGSEPLTLEPTLMLRVGRPSCQVYTLAWYYLRLITSREDWVKLSLSSDCTALRDRIATEAVNVSLRRRVYASSTLLTSLPSYLRKNETESMVVATHLRHTSMRTLLTANNAVGNQYYEGPSRDRR